MEQNGSDGKKDWQQQIFLAKNLIRRFSVLHNIHIQQLEGYVTACCNISIPEGSTVEIQPDQKTAVFKINTIFEYKREFNKFTNKHVFVKRKKHDLGRKIAKFIYPEQRKKLGMFIIKGTHKHELELQMAAINLVTWTKEILWGEETKVKVIIDGQEIFRKR